MRQIVAVDSQGCSPKTSGGAGVYAHELVGRLLKHGAIADQSFKVVPVRYRHDDLMVSQVRSRDDLLRVSKKALSRLLPSQTQDVIRGISARIASSSDPKSPRFQPHVTHQLTNYFSGPSVHRWVENGAKLCVTFLDIQDVYLPEFFSPAELEQRKREYAFYIERSELFFSISEFTKKTMVEHFKIPSDRIIVTPLAAALPDAVVAKGAELEVVSDLEHYFLFPARYWRHKNHRFLFKAAGLLREKFFREKAAIVLTGHFSEEDTSLMHKEIESYGAQGLVRHFGFLPLQAKMDLLRNASALVFPSLFEGFGMPVLEAMEVGCPVFASTTTSIPEVGGEAAFYFDTNRVDSLVELFEGYFDGRLDLQKHVQLGRERASKFTWQRNADLTLEGYRRLT